MKLLEQCQKWNEEDEFQKIIDTLEAIPAGERTPEMDSELARAYKMCIRDRLSVVENAGHAVNEENPKALARVLDEYYVGKG